MAKQDYEAPEDTLMLNLLTTTYMSIAKVSYSSYSLMTFVLAKPFVKPLYLGSFSFQVIPGNAVVTGHITPGTSATAPGRANMLVSQDIYDSLLAMSTATGKHGVQLIYDDLTLAPTAISIV